MYHELRFESYRKHLFPEAVSPTYDKAADKLAEIMHTNKSLTDTIENLKEFTDKFTCGFNVWDELYHFQVRKSKEDGTFTNEHRFELFLQLFANSNNSFPWTFRFTDKPGGFGNRKCSLDAQINNFHTVLLKTLVDNDFDYENDMWHIFNVAWDHISGDNCIDHSCLWYEINITNYESFKNLPKIRQSLNTYQKIALLTYKSSKTKWIGTLKVTEDTDYIIKNIEQNIRFDLESKKLWKLYFRYTKKYAAENNSNEQSLKKLLDLYQRYCRFKVDDLKFRRRYRKEIDKAAAKKIDTTKWELDIIKLEYDFGSKEIAEKNLLQFAFDRKARLEVPSGNFIKIFKLLQQQFIQIKKPMLQPKIYFTKSGIIYQYFDFPESLIYYICQAGNYKLSQNLQKSSKQLFLTTNKILCFKFSISEICETQILKESLFISAANPKINNIKNLSVFNTIFVSTKNEKILSFFLPKFSSCNVRFLILHHQNLTFKEYNFLTNSKNVKGIIFKLSTVKDSNGTSISLEQLMNNLPNAENIEFVPSPAITNDTFLVLKTLERKVKIQTFSLFLIPSMIKTADLCSFITAHVGSESMVNIHFQLGVDCYDLLYSIKEMLDSWNPISDQPIIKIENHPAKYYS